MRWQKEPEFQKALREARRAAFGQAIARLQQMSGAAVATPPPNQRRVPGVLGIVRYRREELIMNIGGERKTMRAENEPAYSAIYELENPAVLTGPEWNEPACLTRSA
jgi:hypothetical protein